MDGTRVHTLELIGALARRGDVRLRVVLPAEVGVEAQDALQTMPGVELIAEADVSDDTPRSDIAHRPWQVYSAADLALLDRLGERTVVTVQDLIAFRGSKLFGSADEWAGHRRLAAHAMGVASAVFFSDEAASVTPWPRISSLSGAGAGDLVRRRPRPVLGEPGASGPGRPGRRLSRARSFVVCLGNRFRHKNLVFALARGRAATRGPRLGRRPRHRRRGAPFTEAPPATRPPFSWASMTSFAAHVVEVGAVSEGDKRWLPLEQADAVLIRVPTRASA